MNLSIFFVNTDSFLLVLQNVYLCIELLSVFLLDDDTKLLDVLSDGPINKLDHIISSR